MPSLTSAPILTPDPKTFHKGQERGCLQKAKGMAAFLEEQGERRDQVIKESQTLLLHILKTVVK